MIGILLFLSALSRIALAESRQLSWGAVTTYTDGTPIGADKVVKYTVCWSNDPWLATETLRTLDTLTTATSLWFDPAIQGMVDYQTIYFTIKTVLSTGEESAYSAVLPWDPAPVPPGTPMAPANLGITRISASTSSGTWQLFWDPVTRYSDGTPIVGKTVKYTLYWTTDAGMSVASLTPLASSIAETSVTFDPAAAGMSGNQRVYFATRSAMSTGEESLLSAALSWRVSNKGPGSPSNGRIVRKNKK